MYSQLLSKTKQKKRQVLVFRYEKFTKSKHVTAFGRVSKKTRDWISILRSSLKTNLFYSFYRIWPSGFGP